MKVLWISTDGSTGVKEMQSLSLEHICEAEDLDPTDYENTTGVTRYVCNKEENFTVALLYLDDSDTDFVTYVTVC